MADENFSGAPAAAEGAQPAAGSVGSGTFANDGMSGGGSGINGIGIGKSAPKAPKDPAAAPQSEEMFEVQVDGVTERMTRKEALEHARLGKAAFKRMQEAADVRKKAESSLSKFKDPEAFIEALIESGLTEEQVRTKFEDWYEKRVIKPSEMSPEQRRIAELEERIARREQQDAKTAKEAAAAKQSQLHEHWEKKYQQDIIGALENSGLPRDTKTVQRMAYYMNENIRTGAGLPLSELVERVRSDYRSELRQLTKSFNPQQFVDFLGEDNAKVLASHYAQKLRERRQPAPPQGTEISDDRPTKKAQGDYRITPATSKSWIPVVD